MMIKLAANNKGTNKKFKPKTFQSKRKGQTKNSMTNVLQSKKLSEQK